MGLLNHFYNHSSVISFSTGIIAQQTAENMFCPQLNNDLRIDDKLSHECELNK